MASQPEDHDGGQCRQERRQRHKDGVVSPEFLLGADDPGLLASPADHQVRFRASGLDGLDDLDGPHDAAGEPAADLFDGPVLVDPPAAEPAQRDQVEAANSHAHSGQEGVEGKHGGHEEDQREQADQRRRQLTGDQPGHARRADHPADDVAGETMLEEVDRKLKHVLQEPHGFGEGQADLQAGEVNLLKGHRGHLHDRRGRHGDQQWLDPCQPALNQDLINENALIGRGDQGRKRQSKARQDHKERADFDAANRLARPMRVLGRRPLRTNRGPGVKVKAIPLTPPGELLPADRSPAARRVVQIDLAPPEALDNQEMIPFPEDNHGHRLGTEPGGRLAKGLNLQAVLLGGFLDVQGIAAVPRDAAIGAQDVQRNVASMIFENDPQRGCPALDGFHLEDRGRSHRAICSLARFAHALQP